MSAITIENDLVHYEVLGRGRPVIFVHGWLGSWRYWVPTMQQLSMKYRTYALDLWGFGDSGKETSKYGFAEQVKLLNDFMEKLGIAKAALVGHSLGAAICLRYACQYPDRAPRLALISPPLFDLGGLDEISVGVRTGGTATPAAASGAPATPAPAATAAATVTSPAPASPASSTQVSPAVGSTPASVTPTGGAPATTPTTVTTPATTSAPVTSAVLASGNAAPAAATTEKTAAAPIAASNTAPTPGPSPTPASPTTTGPATAAPPAPLTSPAPASTTSASPAAGSAASETPSAGATPATPVMPAASSPANAGGPPNATPANSPKPLTTPAGATASSTDTIPRNPFRGLGETPEEILAKLQAKNTVSAAGVSSPPSGGTQPLPPGAPALPTTIATPILPKTAPLGPIAATTAPPAPATAPTRAEAPNPLLGLLTGIKPGALLVKNVDRDAPDLDKLRAEVEKIDEAAIIRSAQSFAGINLAVELHRVASPTLLLHGKDDPLLPAPSDELLERIAKGKPEGNLLAFVEPDLRHFPMLEITAKFNRLLMDFLDAQDLTNVQFKDQWRRTMR